MAGFSIQLNPTSDPLVSHTAQLDLSDAAVSGGVGYRILDGTDFPPPAAKPAYASSYDTEGSLSGDAAHYENREITLQVRVIGSSAGNLEAKLNALTKMVGLINSEGGSLKLTTPAGTVCYFDLEREAAPSIPFDRAYANNRRCDCTVTFQARPFWRGAEVDLGSNSETTLPALVFVEAGQDGDVPSLGRLVITDSESGGKDRWTVIVGGDSRYYSSAATNALFYQAEDLTPTGTSTKTAGASGASGSGSNVVRNTDLTTTYQAVLKSEVDATNAALTHKGTLNLWVRTYRPAGNTGAVSITAEWAEGDFTRVTRNDAVSFAADEREGVFVWSKLGVVSIDPTSTRWEFRLLAKSTVAGDEIDADCFFLAPTEVTYIELSGKLQFQNPTSFSALSTMDTESGAITGDSATVGGVWAGAGDATDFSAAAGVATRSEIGDADVHTGRYLVSGVAGFAAQTVQIDTMASAATSGIQHGVIARYTDVNNWFRAEVVWSGLNLRVWKRVGGTPTQLITSPTMSIAANTWYSLRLQVDAAGRWFVWWFPQGTTPSTPVLKGQDSVLATGGTLASGKPGFYDANLGGTATTRSFDNFLAFAPTADAAIFGQQSLELRHDGATREDSTGTFSTKVSDRRGRYLKIPPAGPESRSTRLAILALPNDPYTMGDAAAIYDLSAQLFVTPRGLVVPEA